MTESLFGTDGVRGTAGVYPLDPPTIRGIGAALVQSLPSAPRGVQLLVGRDTRESGQWIEEALASGASGLGAHVVSGGVIPTPAVAFLTRALRFDAGVVISASHNPFQDNGIKIFSGTGTKLSEDLELAIESRIRDAPMGDDHEAGRLERRDLTDHYLAHARGMLRDARPLGDLCVVADCANGAMSGVAPRLFRELGLETKIIHCDPDGRNINAQCGSTYPEALARFVRQGGHRFGVAFDGDGDRAIFVGAGGRIVDGDAVLFICARHLQQAGQLRGNAVVATVMSNIGLEIALRELGIELVRCAVGDKYVMEELTRRQLSLGGEQSGHIIFTDYQSTGDGLATALAVLQAMADSGRELDDLARDLVVYPQVLLNVRVRDKAALEEVPDLASVMREVERRLGDRGRLLVRYSGTEPLLRIMLEGQSEDEIRAWAGEIADTARQHLGK